MGVILVITVVLTYAVFFRTAEVDGTSMYPTYSSSDLLLLFRLGKVKHGDIVAIYNDQLHGLLCKRIIGLAGDHIVADETGLYINDEFVTESYVASENWYELSASFDVTVPAGEVFVMGDNRLVSMDSRVLGCMATSDILGVVILNATKSFGISRKTIQGVATTLIVISIIALLIQMNRSKASRVECKGD